MAATGKVNMNLQVNCDFSDEIVSSSDEEETDGNYLCTKYNHISQTSLRTWVSFENPALPFSCLKLKS